MTGIESTIHRFTVSTGAIREGRGVVAINLRALSTAELLSLENAISDERKERGVRYDACFYVVVAERLRQLRQDAGLSLDQLSARAGLSRRAIVGAEARGKSTEPTLTRLAAALGVDLLEAVLTPAWDRASGAADSYEGAP